MKEKIMELAKELIEKEDLTVFEEEERIYLTVNDFEGFDGNFQEIERQYDVDKVNQLYNYLKDNCESEENDFYHYFNFDGFYVVWGYESFDI